MTYEEAEQYLERELAASAAGYPGANDDLTTYVRMEMLKERPGTMIELFEKEIQKKPCSWW